MAYSLRENNEIYRQLMERIDSGHMVHAFLFAGGSDLSRRELARAFAADLVQGHREDTLMVERREGKAGIGVEEVEDLIGRMAYKPYGERYAVIIGEAHLMGAAAQNKLLKTLEEPVSPAVIMLLAENREAMLKTVISRCSVYQLKEPALEADEGVRAAAQTLLSLCGQQAPFYKKKAAIGEILADKDRQRERALMLVNLLEELVLEEARGGDDSRLAVIPALREARRALRQVHNTAYTLKQLCLHV